jgi:hypothetical protein
MADRDDPRVLQAYAIGAVACPICDGVHVDFLDEGENIIATGFLQFEQWRQLIDDVGVPASRIRERQ